MKKAWLLVGANVIVALMVALYLFAILTALGVMASYVTTWPLFALLGCGAVLGSFAIPALKRLEGAKTQIIGHLLNCSALLLYSLVIVVISWMFLSATTERFILPEGYQGEVYVVHGVPGGAREERSFYRTETYRIPDDGVLLSQTPMAKNETRPQYFYESKDGKLIRIRNEWYSTIQPTPENLADNKNVGMYFPRVASRGDKVGCDGPADLFEIGTPSFLLSKHPRIDLTMYLKEHAVACVRP